MRNKVPLKQKMAAKPQKGKTIIPRTIKSKKVTPGWGGAKTYGGPGWGGPG